MHGAHMMASGTCPVYWNEMSRAVASVSLVLAYFIEFLPTEDSQKHLPTSVVLFQSISLSIMFSNPKKPFRMKFPYRFAILATHIAFDGPARHNERFCPRP